MTHVAPSQQFIDSLALADKAVLVTGGAAGIGWAAARLLARAGARVMIADIDANRAEARARELGPSHAGLGVDIAVGNQVIGMIDRCVAVFGRIDVLVNNAGLTTTGGVGVIDQSLSEFDRIMSVNLAGTINASEHAAAAMKAAGRGVIVNLASGAGLRPVPFRGAYSASKAGIIAITRTHAAAWHPDGVRVNAVAPGYTRTELVEALIRSGRVDPEAVAQKIPLGRIARPEEIAAVIAFLASDRSAALAGEVFIADGGSLLGNAVAADFVGTTPASISPELRPVYLVAGVGSELGVTVARCLGGRGCRTLLAASSDDGAVAAGKMSSLDHCLNLGPVMADEFSATVRSALAKGERLDGAVFVANSQPAPVSALRATAQAVGPILMQAGLGAFVTITDNATPNPGNAADAAVLSMLTRTLAVEWSGRRVRVNAIEVDAVNSSRMSEIAELAHFLLSPEASYVTGSVLTAYGGRSPER